MPKSPKKKPAPKGEKSSSGKSSPDEDSIRAGQEVMCETRRIFEESGFSVKAIADELALIAFADMKDFLQIDEQGSVKAISIEEMKKNSKAIKRVREKRRILNGKEDDTILEDTFEFELHDKLDALGKAISVIGIQKPAKVEHTGKVGLKIEVIDKFENPA